LSIINRADEEAKEEEEIGYRITRQGRKRK